MPPGRERIEHRALLAAAGGREVAARGEGAAGRDRGKARRRPLDRRQHGTLRAATRHRSEQPARIGMVRLGEDLGDAADLDDPPRIHHRHPVAGPGDDAEIMGDEDDAHGELVAQVEDQLEDLVLDRHVERRGRLVGEEQLGVAGERDGDHHPLAACRPRTGAGSRPAGARRRECRRGPAARSPACGAGACRASVCAARFSSICTRDREHRIERRRRLLEDHRDLAAADPPQRPCRHGEKVLPPPQHAAGDFAGRMDEPHQRAQRHALAGPASRRRAPAPRPA